MATYLFTIGKYSPILNMSICKQSWLWSLLWSARSWHSHWPGSRLPLLAARPVVSLPASQCLDHYHYHLLTEAQTAQTPHYTSLPY